MAEIREFQPGVQATLQTIRAACRAVDGQDPMDEASQLRLKHHGLDGARLWVLDEAGFAFLHDGALDLAVAPASRRHGVGTALAEAASAETSSAWSHGDHPGAVRLAARHGFARVRELWVMRRPARLELGDVVVPPGVRIRHWEPGDEADLLRVNAAAFAHHPEQGGMDEANLAARMAEPWFDPAGLLVATEGERMLGFHWTKQHSADLGEVYVVGISPDAQGRGLGRALTLAGLHHLAGLGVSEVLLYVEADNHAARSTYAKLGFAHADADTHVMYRREV